MRFDAKFWGFLLVGSLVASTLGCLGVAVAAQSASADTTGIISMSDALHQIDRPTTRVGVMTERVRRPESLVVAAAGR